MPEFINNQRLAGLAGVDFDSEEIKPGPIVYTRTHLARRQFKKLRAFPPCVLITSFSDDHLSDSMAKVLPSNVRKWFSNNVESTNPRVEAVPIGLRTSMEGEDKLRTARGTGRGPDTNLVYLNFWRQLCRKPNPRVGIYEEFAGKSWVTAEGGTEHIPMDRFYEGMNTHPYVISPPGAGDDCHRHWEAILLGSIPIVLKSPVTKILEGFPCLFVNNWGEVTEERLLKDRERIQPLFKSPIMEKIWFDYWQKRIFEVVL